MVEGVRKPYLIYDRCTCAATSADRHATTTGEVEIAKSSILLDQPPTCLRFLGCLATAYLGLALGVKESQVFEGCDEIVFDYSVCMSFFSTGVMDAPRFRLRLPAFALDAFFLAYICNDVAMCQSYIAKRHYRSQSRLILLQLLVIFSHSIFLVRTLQLTMLHLQSYCWTSMTPLYRKYQANKAPHGFEALLNRG